MVHSTVGWPRVGGELVHFINNADNPDDYDGPFAQSKNADFGCIRRHPKELVIRIVARILVGGEILAPTPSLCASTTSCPPRLVPLERRRAGLSRHLLEELLQDAEERAQRWRSIALFFALCSFLF
eukprot:SAG31_NODE_3024_length_4780_cov_2.631275_1_plen_125_part_10